MTKGSASERQEEEFSQFIPPFLRDKHINPAFE